MTLSLQDFLANYVGGPNDVVALHLNGEEVLLAEAYEVHCSILNQPSSFALTVGHEGTTLDFIKRFPPGSKFELYINRVPQMSGILDGPEVRGDNGSAIDFEGRDYSRFLNDDTIDAEAHFRDYSYADIVHVQLFLAGIDNPTILTSNAENRSNGAGVKVKALSEPLNADTIAIEKGKKNTVQRSVECRMGEKRIDFVRRIIDRAGLFLWAASTPNTFVLSAPNVNQPPTYSIFRTQTNGSNARLKTYRNRAQPPRYTECIVYGRTGGKKYGRARIKDGFVDEEMRGWGFNTKLVIRDANVANPEQAERFARRKLAEGRRSQWQLFYEVEGHSTRTPDGRWAVWTPDTIVHVTDEFLGIDEDMWIDDVIYSRSSQDGTTTTLGLMRKGDLFFGEDTE